MQPQLIAPEKFAAECLEAKNVFALGEERVRVPAHFSIEGDARKALRFGRRIHLGFLWKFETAG